MTRSEREQLIERYLREDLTPAEEQDFFIEAATDKELRFDLKASRVVENAFRKDREAAPSAYGPMRTHLAGLLAASRAEEAKEEEAPTPQRHSTPSKSASRPSLGWIVTAASIGLISITSLMIGIFALDGDNGLQRKTPAPIERNIDAHELSVPQPPALNNEGATEASGVRDIPSMSKPEGRMERNDKEPLPPRSAGPGRQTSPETASNPSAPAKTAEERFNDTTRPKMDGQILFEGLPPNP